MKIRHAHLPGSFNRQQGIVIVVALFFVALVATMSYYMMSRLSRDTERTSLLLNTTQAEFYAQGSIDWARETLKENLSKQKPNNPVDTFPLESPVNEVNGYAVSSTITDMQSRFNLNNLTDQDSQTDFKHLVQILNPQSDDAINQIMLAIVDWIRTGQQDNEYNKYYLHLSPGYRAAHRLMTSASELQLIKGMTPKLFERLQNDITALPEQTKINVLTAPAAVIASLSPQMTMATGDEIVKIRAQKKIASVQDFLNLDILKNHKIPEKKITVLSQYFLVETRVKIENQQIVLYTLLQRSGEANKNSVKIIWQSKGLEG